MTCSRGPVAVAVLAAIASLGVQHEAAWAGGPSGETGPPNLQEEQKLLASDGMDLDVFGSVSLSGDRALVGAWGDDDRGEDSGSAYVFERDEESGEWNEVAKLLPPPRSNGDRFGFSVSLLNDRALVGAPMEDLIGAAYVFERDHAGIWTSVAELVPSDGAVLDYFAHRAVSLSGDRALVGATHHDDLGTQSGAAYVFERDVAGNWSEVAKLLASDGGSFEYFGENVSLSGDRALLGATTDDLGINSGSAYIFEREHSGTWVQVVKLLASDGELGDVFGTDVSLSGDRALVGAEGDDDRGDHAGATYVFERDDSGSWVEVAKLLDPDGSEGDSFGGTVSLSGDRALIGAPGPAGLGHIGVAHLFERAESGEWVHVARLLASDPDPDDRFAWEVSLSGDRALVGAAWKGLQGRHSGAAYVFAFENCSLGLRLDPPTLRPGENLEVAIRLEHNRPQTVTVPFRVWIEAADGSPVASRSTGPRTLHHGDRLDVRLTMTLPRDLPPGSYRAVVGVERMEQGLAWAARPFRVEP